MEDYEGEDNSKPSLANVGGLSPTPSTPDATSLLVQTNPAELVEDIEHHLKGELWIPIDKKWDKKGVRLLNDTGVSKVMNLVRSIVNTNAILSNLTDKEIGRIIITIGDEIIYLVIMNLEEFKVKKCDIRTICNMCGRLCFLALKRCQNEGERRFLKTSVRSSEYIQFRHQPAERQDRGRPFFGLFNKG